MGRFKIDTEETENIYLIVEVYGEYSRNIISLIGKYSRLLTVLFALLTLLLGVVAAFFQIKTIGGVRIEWVRLPMSAMTLLAAITTFSRVIPLSAHGSGQAKGSAKSSVQEPDE